MKTATVRDLRNSFSKLEVWLAEGEEIHIKKRGKPIAILTSWGCNADAILIKPDFAARRKII